MKLQRRSQVKSEQDTNIEATSWEFVIDPMDELFMLGVLALIFLRDDHAAVLALFCTLVEHFEKFLK